MHKLISFNTRMYSREAVTTIEGANISTNWKRFLIPHARPQATADLLSTIMDHFAFSRV